MGNTTEFERVSLLLAESLTFGDDINVSVFETNIRGNVQCKKEYSRDDFLA